MAIIYYAAFMNVAWRQEKAAIPLQIVPEKHRQSFRELEFRDGIAKAASLARDDGRVSVQRPELVYAVQGKMYPDMECYGAWGEISRGEFEQLISAVKSRILDFALKIEEKNPAAGEAVPNSVPVPKEDVRSLVQNHFYAPVGTVAQNSSHVSQHVAMNIQSADLNKLVTELTAHLRELELDERQRARAEAQLAIIRTELSGELDDAIVAQAGRTLRSITESAIGSLLAVAAQPGIWAWIHQTLNTLSK